MMGVDTSHRDTKTLMVKEKKESVCLSRGGGRKRKNVDAVETFSHDRATSSSGAGLGGPMEERKTAKATSRVRRGGARKKRRARGQKWLRI